MLANQVLQDTLQLTQVIATLQETFLWHWPRHSQGHNYGQGPPFFLPSQPPFPFSPLFIQEREEEQQGQGEVVLLQEDEVQVSSEVQSRLRL